MFRIVNIFNKIMIFIEHDLQNNTFCNVFMSFYNCRTYVVYGTTDMWITWNFVLKEYCLLIARDAILYLIKAETRKA